MKNCSFCGRRAVYYQRSAGVYRCDRCLTDYVEKKFRKTISNHSLIEPGEKIVAAVSGGTDSVTNLKLLADFSNYRDIEIMSLTIDEGIKGYRDESLPIARKNAEELEINHIVISFEEVYGKTLDDMAEISREKNGPDTCTLCGILRRSLMNQASRELEGDKLAVAHNLDDVTQTILLNYLRGDMSRLYRLGPKTRGKEEFVPRIKPLREITEKEIAIYSMLNNLGTHIDNCPYVGGMRSEVRDFLNKMEKNHPTTKYKILRMFDDIKPHLPIKTEDFSLKECEICGEPATNTLCRPCKLLDKLGIKRKEKRLISK